jgi:hypothetical protein
MGVHKSALLGHCASGDHRKAHSPLTCMWIYDMIDHAMTAAGWPRFPS